MGLYEILKSQDNTVVGKQGSIFLSPDAGTKASKATGYDSFDVYRIDDGTPSNEHTHVGRLITGLGNAGAVFVDKLHPKGVPPSPEQLNQYDYIREFINLLAVSTQGAFKLHNDDAEDTPSLAVEELLSEIAPYTEGLKLEYAEAVYITPTKYSDIVGVEIEGKGFLPLRYETNYYRYSPESTVSPSSTILKFLTGEAPLKADGYKDDNEKAEGIFDFVTSKVTSPEKAKEVQYEIASLFAKYSGEGKEPIPAILLSIVEFLKKAHLTNAARSYQMQIFEALL